MADHSKRVLIVDDEREFLVLLGKMVQKKGYTVLAADNGEDALNIALTQGPDLIILDIMMPGMNGREVAKRLAESEDTKDIPVIYLTGLISDQKDIVLENSGAGKVVFPKPCKMEDLLEAMNRLIDGKPVSG